MPNELTISEAPSIKLTPRLRAMMVPTSSGELTFARADAAEVGAGLKRLLGCYPNGKPGDPQVYVAAITAVLAQYPNEIVRQITDPVQGVPSHCKFLPTVAELTEALNKAMAPNWSEYREAVRIGEQLAERRRIAEVRNPENEAKVREKILELRDSLSRVPDAGEDLKREAFRLQGERTKRVLAEVAAKKSGAPTP